MRNTCDHCCTKVEHLTVKFGGNVVLDNVGLHVNCGEVIAIVGPNGAGKTTLLRAILGELPYDGMISYRVCGDESKNPKVGYVPQKLQFDADSPISVADLVSTAIGRKPVWMGLTAEALEKARKALSLFSVEHLLNRRIGELSGGELQRVLLAIAMTPEPDLLLLDEAASGVDVNGLSLFYQTIADLRKKHDISVILVTHDLAGISPYVDRLILLNRSIVAEGEPKEVLSDEKLVKVFGQSLWNISRLPSLIAPEDDKNGRH